MNGPPEFDIEPPVFRLEPTERWVRVKAGGEWIADSRNAMLLSWHGPDGLPTYVLPADDVRTDLLTPSSDAAPVADFMFPNDLHVGEVQVPSGAFLLKDPPPPFEAADGYWTFEWHDRRIEWFEEATKAYSHARDTRHRVDAIPSERHVRVELGGVVLAESDRPLALFETGLPTRWYFPEEDVRTELLEASGAKSRCPYKGKSEFFSVRVGDELHPDRAWRYPEPIPENPLIKGMYAFFNEHVDLIVDGERLKRPFTPWSFDARA